MDETRWRLGVRDRARAGDPGRPGVSSRSRVGAWVGLANLVSCVAGESARSCRLDGQCARVDCLSVPTVLQIMRSGNNLIQTIKLEICMFSFIVNIAFLKKLKVYIKLWTLLTPYLWVG